jgi:hypothetical protein
LQAFFPGKDALAGHPLLTKIKKAFPRGKAKKVQFIIVVRNSTLRKKDQVHVNTGIVACAKVGHGGNRDGFRLGRGGPGKGINSVESKGKQISRCPPWQPGNSIGSTRSGLGMHDHSAMGYDHYPEVERLSLRTGRS